MPDGNIFYTYKHAPTIRQFKNSNAFIRGLMGPFGSGKSSGCVIEMIRRTQEQKPQGDGIRRARFGVIRNTYQQLTDTTIKTVMDWLPERYFGRYNRTEHTYRVTGIPGLEIEILFRALDKPPQVQNLLSLELTGAWVNEAREVPWEIIKPLTGRVGRYPAKKDGGPAWFGVFMDTNPPDNDSWWYRLFETDEFTGLAKEVEKKLGRKYAEVFKQPSGLSPKAENIVYLASGYYELLAADPDEAWVKVHVHGEYGFIKAGKPVYPEYRDNLHCRAFKPIRGLPIYRGWDYGLTPACVFAQLIPGGRLVFFDELCATRAGIDAFSDVVVKHCKLKYKGFDFIDRGDPSGETPKDTDEKTCFQIQHGKGIDVEGGKQNLELRLSSVRYGLNNLIDGIPALTVTPDCPVLRKGFQGGYNYKRVAVSGEARYHDKPDKNRFSHPHDGAQYIAAEIFGDLVTNDQESKQPGRRHKAEEMNSPLDDEIIIQAVAIDDEAYL